jgi:arsenate reductase
MLNEKLQAHYTMVAQEEIPDTRKRILEPLIAYVSEKMQCGERPVLNFICTHNSRRSQFAQIHAAAAAHFHGIDISSLSGGVEVTAFNANAVSALRHVGFEIPPASGKNPRFTVRYGSDKQALEAFSKLYDDSVNTASAFAAVMTCAHADENCPYIPGTEARIALNYQDPKVYDNTPLAEVKYQERSHQIAAEMLYVFNQVKNKTVRK